MCTHWESWDIYVGETFVRRIHYFGLVRRVVGNLRDAGHEVQVRYNTGR